MEPKFDVPPPGAILAGKYRVENVLGVGGMGVVVSAYHNQLHQKVAVKFLNQSEVGNKEWRSRFEQEGRAAVQLKSEHVAKIIDVGNLENGCPYLVMEFLEGVDLSEIIDRSVAQGEFLDVGHGVDFILQAIDAIGEAHSLQIVHRDLKPANLFLATGIDGSESIKVLDFGISKRMDTVGSMTSTNAMLGTPLYMSPEQFRSAKTVGQRSDIWALGVILYEVLTGRPPFGAENLGIVCAKILEEDPEPISRFRNDVPPALEEAVFRCLRKKPEDRFVNVAELALALAPFGSPESRRCVDRAVRLLSGAGHGAASRRKHTRSANNSAPQALVSEGLTPPPDSLGSSPRIVAMAATPPPASSSDKPSEKISSGDDLSAANTLAQTTGAVTRKRSRFKALLTIFIALALAVVSLVAFIMLRSRGADAANASNANIAPVRANEPPGPTATNEARPPAKDEANAAGSAQPVPPALRPQSDPSPSTHAGVWPPVRPPHALKPAFSGSAVPVVAPPQPPPPPPKHDILDTR